MARSKRKLASSSTPDDDGNRARSRSAAPGTSTGGKRAKKRATKLAGSRAGSEAESDHPTAATEASTDPFALHDEQIGGDTSVEEMMDEELYCVCQTLYDGDRVMLACDVCDQWYHTTCMKIRDDDAALVERFVCTLCRPHTTLRTTWKTKCRRATCKSAALLPLSKFCSEACGVAHMHALITRSLGNKRSKSALEAVDKLYGPAVAAARPRAGVPQWVDNPPERGTPAAGTAGPPSLPKPVPDAGLSVTSPEGLTALWNQRFSSGGVCVMGGRVYAPPPSDRLPEQVMELVSFAARHGQAVDETFELDVGRAEKISHESGQLEEEVARARVELDETMIHSSVVEQQQEVAQARLTLILHAIARIKNLPRGEPQEAPSKPKKNGASRSAAQDARCGYDERFAWSDKRLAPYTKVAPAWKQIDPGCGKSAVGSSSSSEGTAQPDIELTEEWPSTELDWDEVPNPDGTYRDDVHRPIKVCASARRCKLHAGWQELHRTSAQIRQQHLVREPLRAPSPSIWHLTPNKNICSVHAEQQGGGAGRTGKRDTPPPGTARETTVSSRGDGVGAACPQASTKA